MNPCWAVARQTVAESLRMRIAWVFLVLIGLIVFVLPFSITGDSSLTGAVQSFLQYGLSGTAILLSVLTIFMSRTLSEELVQKQILLLLTKPLPRWQFVLGKWLGLTILNAMFLAGAGLSIFLMVLYIIWTVPPINAADEQSLASEVLVARHSIRFTPPDFDKTAEREYERRLEEGAYRDVGELSRERFIQILKAKQQAQWRTVTPLGRRTFRFHNVLCDRSPGHRIQLRYYTEIANYAPDEIFRSIWDFGNRAQGTLLYRAETHHVVGRFHTIPAPARTVADDHTLTVNFYNQDPRLVRGHVRTANVIQFLESREVELLFVVGTFGGNLVRVLVILMLKLMFLAAVSLMFTTVLSFPVACMTSFAVYACAGGRKYILESLDFATDDRSTFIDAVRHLGTSLIDFDTQTFFTALQESMMHVIVFVFSTLHYVFPDFGYFDPVETFVSGRNVSLVWVLEAVRDLGLIQTLGALGLAMLFFHRREVAEISV